MIAPEQVSTLEYATHGYDEMKTGAIMSAVAGVGLIALSFAHDTKELNALMDVAGGISLTIAYNCAKKATAYRQRYFDLIKQDY